MYKKHVKKGRSLGGIIGCILFLLLIAATAYFLFFSSFFLIKEIEIKTTENISEAEVRRIIQGSLDKKKFKLLSQENLILTPLEKIKADILDLSPEIESVIINKKMPNWLGVEIMEYQNVGIWCQIREVEPEEEPEAESEEEPEELIQERETEIVQCFNIDKNGVIYEKASLVKSSLILTIYDSRGQPAKIKDKIASEEMMDFIGKAKRTLNSYLKIRIDNFEIISENDFIAKTSEGWLIYFSSAYSMESQMESLRIILNELVKERQSLEYIDLRIEGRAYYR